METERGEHNPGFFDALLTSWLRVSKEATGEGEGTAVSVNEMVATVCRLARAIPQDELRNWIDAQNRKHTTMPILNPTAYRKEMPDIEAWVKLGSLVLKLANTAEEAYRDAERRMR